jgi:hypothetical protein
MTTIQQRMLVGLIMLTPGHQNKFIDCQQAKVQIAVEPVMDVEIQWNLTVELFQLAYRMRIFTR